MHYMNGRAAQNGDKIVHINVYTGSVLTGVLYDAELYEDVWKGMCAPLYGGAHFFTPLNQCVRLDDFVAAQPRHYDAPAYIGGGTPSESAS